MDVIDILADLVKIDTTNLPGNEKDIVDYILSKFRGHEDFIEIQNGRNRSSLVVNIEGRTDETVAFIGHIDTVPVADEEAWKFPPFDAHIEGDIMYGRGTSDMKSGVACMVSLGDYFINKDIVPEKNIKLIFTADEERTGKGIISVFEKGYLEDVDFVIVPENTSNDPALKEKGALWISLELFGKSAHGARPDLGINSIEITYEILNDLKIYVGNFPDDELLGSNTVSLNKISGGKSTNIIAEYCKAEIDIRTNPGLGNNEIIKQLEKIISKHEKEKEGLKVKYKILTDRTSFEMEKENKYVKEFMATLNRKNLNYKQVGVTYFTDLSLVIPHQEIPFIIFGPGFIDKGHQVDEHVSIEETRQADEIFLEYLS